MNNQGQFPNMNMFAGNQNPQQQQQQLGMLLEQMLTNNGGINPGMNMNSQSSVHQMSELMMNQSNMQQQQNLMGNYQGMMGQHQDMMGPSHGMLGQNQGTLGQNQGTLGQNQGMLGQNQGTFGQNQGMLGQNQGTLGQNQGMLGQNQGIMGQNQGMFKQNSPIIGQNQGIMGQNQGMFGQSQGISGQNQGIMGQNQGMLGQNQGIMGMQTSVSGIQQGMTGQSNMTDNSNQFQSGSFSNTSATQKSESTKLKSILKNSGSSSTSIASSTATVSTPQPIRSILKKSTPASCNIATEEGQSAYHTQSISHSKTITSQYNPVSTSSITSIGQTIASSLANISRHYSDNTKVDDKFTNNAKSTAAPVASSSRMKTLVTVPTNQTVSVAPITTSSDPAPRSQSSNQTTAYSKTSHSESTTTMSSGLSIPTLVSGGGNRKRKTVTSEKANVKKAKTESSQVSVEPRKNNDDEDPEYVQAQIFISNIDVSTSEGMILEILRHYKFSSPKVWIGKHNTSKEICAFVKLPSLKDSKRVIAEMKGFPYKGREMEIRFSAASDFIDYSVSAKDKALFTASKKSSTTSQPVDQVSAKIDIPAQPSTFVPVEPVLAPIPVGSDYQTVVVPIYPSVVPQYNEQYDDSSGPPPVWMGSPGWQDSAQLYSDAYPNVYDGPSGSNHGSDSRYKSDTRYSRSPDYRFDYSGRPYESSRHSVNRSSLSPYTDQRYRSSPSRGGRCSISPYGDRRSSISPYRNRRSSISPYGNRRSSISPYRHRRSSTSPSRRRTSISPRGRRSSISPSRGQRSNFSPSRRGRSSISPSKGRRSNISPSRGRRSHLSPLRGHRPSISPSRGRRSSISPQRGHRSRDSPGKFRSSTDGSYNRSVHSTDDSLSRSKGEPGTSSVLSSSYCVHIENLPPHLEDSDLEMLIRPYPYDGVRLKVKDGKAEASVTLHSRTDADIMVNDLNKKSYLGADLNVCLLDNRTSGLIGARKEPAGRDRSLNKGKTVEDRKDKTLFQGFIDASYVDAPVLGRKYVKEFVSHDKSTVIYLCILCEKICPSRSIADHVMGYKHRLKAIKRSDPMIYNKLCLIQDKLEMMKQCSEYANVLVNKSEHVVSVTETYPEKAAVENLQRIQERKETTAKEKLDSTLEKKSASDSTSDIFKKIAAYKKKFEASQDSTEEEESKESPAKRLRTGSGKTRAMTSKFEDLQRQNKSLADSIVAEIASARQDTDLKVTPKRSDRRNPKLKDEGSKNVGKRLENVRSKRPSQTNESKSVRETSGKVSDSRDKGKAEFDRKSLQKAVAQSRARAVEIKKALSEDNQRDETLVEDHQKPDRKERSDKLQNETEQTASDKVKVKDKSITNVVQTVGEDATQRDQMKQVVSEPEVKPVDKSKEKLSLEKAGADVEAVKEDANKSKQNTSQADKAKRDIMNKVSIKDVDIKHAETGISAELLEEGLVDMEEEFELTKEMEREKDISITITNPSSHPRSTLIDGLNEHFKAGPDSYALLGMEHAFEVISGFGNNMLMYYCSLCRVKDITAKTFANHLLGMKHRKKYLEAHFFKKDKKFKGIALSRKDYIISESVKLWQQLKDNLNLQKIITMTAAEFKEKKITDRKNQVVDFSIEKKSDTTEYKKEPPVSSAFRDTINFAKQNAKAVDMLEGRETVEFYKYMRQKPDVPILGLDSTIEIQGFHGQKTKACIYVCQLCNPVKKIDAVENFYCHMTGNKHMENYLKQNYPNKMIHLKLITHKQAKNAYLLNQAKLVCQTQGNSVGSINMVNLVKLEEERKAIESIKAANEAMEAARLKAEAKAARELERVTAEALSEAAKERDRTRDEAAAVVKAANAKALDSTAGIGTSAIPTVTDLTDLTTGGNTAAPVTAHLYQIIAGVQDKAIVGLNYITEIHGIPEDGGLPRYQCSLCHNEIIPESRIKSHLTGNNHMLNFLKMNYPVFYSKAEGKYEEALSYCKEIEEQFGRESVSIKTRLKSASDKVMYSTPVISKAPDYSSHTSSVLWSSPEKKGRTYADEGGPYENVEFYKLLKITDTCPLVGLQFLKEVHHPVRKCAPVYECLVCKIMGQNFLTVDNVVDHLHTTVHRLNFFKENHFHIYKEITSISDHDERQKLLAKRTEEIESKVGRGIVEKVVSKSISYWKEDISVQSPSKNEPKSEGHFWKPDEDQKQFECKRCHETVASRMKECHIIACHEINIYTCKKCQLSFPSHRLLSRHNIVMEHKDPVVPKKDVVKHNLNKWFKFHSAKGTLKKSNVTGRLLQMCQRCDRVYKPDIARQHYISCHLQAYKCEVCSITHGSGRELEGHLKHVHDIIKHVKPEPVPMYINMSLYFWDVYAWKKLDKSEPAEMNKSKINESKASISDGKAGVDTVKPGVSSAASEVVMQIGGTDEERVKNKDGVFVSFDLSAAENQEKIMKEIKKLHCTRCQIMYGHMSLAYTHYKDRHAYQYICTHPKCYQKFPTRVRLREHWFDKHKISVDIKLPILSFSECFDVFLNNGERTPFDKTLEIVKKSSAQNMEGVGTSCVESANSQTSLHSEQKSASLDSTIKPTLSAVTVSNSTSVSINVPNIESVSTAVIVSIPQPISTTVKGPITKPAATTAKASNPQSINTSSSTSNTKLISTNINVPNPSASSSVKVSNPPASTSVKVSNPSASSSVKVPNLSASSSVKVSNPPASTSVKVSNPPASTSVKVPNPSASTSVKVSNPSASTSVKVSNPPASTSVKVSNPSAFTSVKVSNPPASTSVKVSNPSTSTSVKAASVSVSSLSVSNKPIKCTSSVSQSQETTQEVIYISDTENSTLEKLLAMKDDPFFDWDSEYDKIVEKMEFGAMISSARKSKFITNYVSKFCTYPLIGLQWITEFQKRDIRVEPWYICELCEDKVTYDCISGHITSVKHRVNYMEKMHPASYSVMKKFKFSSIGALKKKVESLSQEVIKTEGKCPVIKVMIELPQSSDENMPSSTEFTYPYTQDTHTKQATNIGVERNASMLSPNIPIQTMNKPTWESPGYTEKSETRFPPWQKISSFSNQKSSISAAATISNEATQKGTGEDSRKWSHLPSSTVSKNQYLSGKPDLNEGNAFDVTCQTHSNHSKSVNQGHMKQRRTTRFSPEEKPRAATGDSVLDESNKNLLTNKHLTVTVMDKSEKDSKNSENSTVSEVIDLTLDENSSEPESMEVVSSEDLEHLNECKAEDDKQTDVKEIQILTEVPSKPNDVLDPVNECSVEIDEEDFDFDGDFEIKDEVGEPDCMTIEVVPQSPKQLANPGKNSMTIKEMEDVTCSVEIKFDEGIESTQNTPTKCELVEFDHLQNEPVAEFSIDDINVLVLDTTESSPIEEEKSLVKDQEKLKTDERQKTELTDPMKLSPTQVADPTNHDEPISKAGDIRNELLHSKVSFKDTNTVTQEVQQSQMNVKEIKTSNVGLINDDAESNDKTSTKTEADHELIIIKEISNSCTEKEEDEKMLVDDIVDNEGNTVTDNYSAIHLQSATESVSELQLHQDKMMDGNVKMNFSNSKLECTKSIEGTDDKTQELESDLLIETATHKTVLEVSSETLLEVQDEISSLPNDTKLPENENCPSDSSSDIMEFAMDEFVTIDEHCEVEPEQTVLIHHVDNTDKIPKCGMFERNKSSEHATRETSQISCDPLNQNKAVPLSVPDSVPLDSNESASCIIMDEGSNDSTDIEEIFLSNDFIDIDEQSTEEEVKQTDDKLEGFVKYSASDHKDNTHKENEGDDLITVEIKMKSEETAVSKDDTAEVEEIGESCACGQKNEASTVSDNADKQSLCEDMDKNSVKTEVGRNDSDNVDKLDVSEGHDDLEEEEEEEEMDIDNFITLDELDTEVTDEVQLDVRFVDANESEDILGANIPQRSTTWKDKSKPQEIPVFSSSSSKNSNNNCSNSMKEQQKTSIRQEPADRSRPKDKSRLDSSNSSQLSSTRLGSDKVSGGTDIGSDTSVMTFSLGKSEKPSLDLGSDKTTISKNSKAVTNTVPSSAETKTRRDVNTQSGSGSRHASRHDLVPSKARDGYTGQSRRQTDTDRYRRRSRRSGRGDSRDNRTDSRHRSRNTSRHSGSSSNRQAHRDKERECKVSIEID